MKQRFTLILFSLLAAVSVQAAQRSITPEQSLDDDLAGPAVAWLGQITSVLTTTDDTCFILNRVQPLSSSYAFTATKFITCSPGRFEEEPFSTGKIIQVEGNLGPVMMRHIGTQDIEAPLIAAPKLISQPDVTAYSARPTHPSYPYPYYRDPFFDPWYPGVGIGFGYYRRH
ncbi:MAG: hypothetical protein V4568_06855 [Pseudomonadota bacterium]